jgi:hypothetical protein
MEQQMAVVVNEKQSNFELPEEGSYLAVVADVIDLGQVATNFGIKPRVQIVWLLDAYSEETGEQLRLSAFYNASLDPKANLRKDIRSIIGKDVEGTYDLEELLGVNSQLVIQHNSTDKKTYANIVAILKAPKGKFLEIPADFERKIDKDGVGSTENPVNSPGSAKAAQQKKSQPQLKKAAPAPVQSAQPPARPVRRAAPPAVAPEPEPEYEETTEVDEVQEASPAPQPAPAPRRQARTLPPTQPARQAAAPAAAPAAPVIRRARVTAPAPVEPEQDAPITDEDIPF